MLNDFISFVRLTSNKPELFLLEKIVKQGNIVLNLSLNLDEDGKVDRFVNTYKVLSESIDFQEKVTVVGMGFVGITLAIALAKKNQKS